MAQRRADERAVDGHLGHAAGEVVARLVAVFGDPRGQELLQGGKRSRCEHLGLERVLLELLQVPLWDWIAHVSLRCAGLDATETRFSRIAGCRLTAR
jgi:hypothetical protein